MVYRTLSGHLEIAEKLLASNNHISISYCALELRKAIELVVRTQFKDAFYDLIGRRTSMNTLELDDRFQSQSIPKIYKMLKKYASVYATYAVNYGVCVFKEALGNTIPQEVGEICCIPDQLPNSDYQHLDEILHDKKESCLNDFDLQFSTLKDIFERLKFVRNNYTYRIMSIIGDEQEIGDELMKEFYL